MEKNFNGEAAVLFRACFHIEGDWRPFEDGILWENEGPPHPLKFSHIIIRFSILCNNTYKKYLKNYNPLKSFLYQLIAS